MKHSINFGEKNTWSDWHLIPTQQPVFAQAEQKTTYIELGGASGSIDLSTAITGYPIFSNRTGNFNFLYVGDWKDWLKIVDEIKDYLHGQALHATLEDEPDWYYDGRFGVGDMYMDEQHGTISIEYNVSPYKWALVASNEPWLWDTFSFEYGVIGNGTYTDTSTDPPTVYEGEGAYTNIPLTTTATDLDFGEEGFFLRADGNAPVLPVFSAASAGIVITVTQGASITIKNIATDASASVPGLVMYKDGWLYNGKPANVSAKSASGTAYMSIAFRAGRL